MTERDAGERPQRERDSQNDDGAGEEKNKK